LQAAQMLVNSLVSCCSGSSGLVLGTRPAANQRSRFV
jgi:hypothetical protein